MVSLATASVPTDELVTSSEGELLPPFAQALEAAQAEFPERIRVAIVEQRLNEDTVCTTPPKDCSVDPSQALCKYRHLIDYFEMDAHFGVGPVFARHLAHRHYRGGETVVVVVSVYMSA